MAANRRRVVLALTAAACLAWAAVEARHLGRGGRAGADPCAARAPDPAAVESSFAPITEARRAGRTEEALLALRDRTARGPYPGYAWFLLGELAHQEGAFGAAVRDYRAAVEADPSVGDRGAAFGAARAMAERLDRLARHPWAQGDPAELADLHYLKRRLAGGCE